MDGFVRFRRRRFVLSEGGGVRELTSPSRWWLSGEEGLYELNAIDP